MKKNEFSLFFQYKKMNMSAFLTFCDLRKISIEMKSLYMNLIK